VWAWIGEERTGGGGVDEVEEFLGEGDGKFRGSHGGETPVEEEGLRLWDWIAWMYKVLRAAEDSEHQSLS
jgi:hypothetical protein